MIDTDDVSLAGEYDLSITLSLQDYPDVAAKTTNDFKATLFKLDQEIVGNQTYSIGSGPFTFYATDILLSP